MAVDTTQTSMLFCNGHTTHVGYRHQKQSNMMDNLKHTHTHTSVNITITVDINTMKMFIFIETHDWLNSSISYDCNRYINSHTHTSSILAITNVTYAAFTHTMNNNCNAHSQTHNLLIQLTCTKLRERLKSIRLVLTVIPVCTHTYTHNLNSCWSWHTQQCWYSQLPLNCDSSGSWSTNLWLISQLTHTHTTAMFDALDLQAATLIAVDTHNCSFLQYTHTQLWFFAVDTHRRLFLLFTHTKL